jgi:hypothetical protein
VDGENFPQSPLIFFCIKDCLKTVVAVALSSQYYRVTLYSAQSIVWQQKKCKVWIDVQRAVLQGMAEPPLKNARQP